MHYDGEKREGGTPSALQLEGLTVGILLLVSALYPVRAFATSIGDGVMTPSVSRVETVAASVTASFNPTITPKLPNGLAGWYRTVPVVVIHSNAVTVSFYRIDAGPDSLYTTPVAIPQGVHTLTCWYYNDLGDKVIIIMRNFKVDTLAPRVALCIDDVDLTALTTNATISARVYESRNSCARSFLTIKQPGTLAIVRRLLMGARLSASPVGALYRCRWNGRLRTGQPLPPGRYLAEMTLRDEAGNTKMVRKIFKSAARRVLPPAMFPSTAKTPIPILMYHRVGPLLPNSNAIARNLTVTPSDFIRQIAWLKGHGYRALLQNELSTVIQRGKRPKGKVVVITFDDGYKDSYQVIYPILVRFGYRATFFVPTRRIDSSRFVSWRQLEILQAAGMEVGSHTVNHIDLGRASAKTVQRELDDSRSKLEGKLFTRITSFCYPFGSYDSYVVSAVHRAGYLTAVTTKYGRYSQTTNPFTMPRVRVKRSTSISSFTSSVN